MDLLKDNLTKYLNQELQQIILSNPRNKEGAKKIHIRPVELRGHVVFQASEYRNNQVYHHNLEQKDMIEQILSWMEEFRQLELSCVQAQMHVLVSKKGKATVKIKNQNGCLKPVELSHNRKKNYILDPGKRVEFLVDLGIQTKEGKIVRDQYDKFRQINRFLEFIEDILPKLPKDKEIAILDFGCGKSYLTFAMYYFLKELKGYQITITGLDLKEDVIRSCSRLAEKYGYDKLRFIMGDISEYQGMERVDMVVTLHACDTATDYALDKAIRWGAEVILSVPCCQHELNGQIQNEILAPILRYGILKERMAALFTDGIRARILESRGYEVQLLEFIDMEHTPKNILIRAVKTGIKKQGDFQELMSFLHAEPTLALLQQEERQIQ